MSHSAGVSKNIKKNNEAFNEFIKKKFPSEKHFLKTIH